MTEDDRPIFIFLWLNCFLMQSPLLKQACITACLPPKTERWVGFLESKRGSPASHVAQSIKRVGREHVSLRIKNETPPRAPNGGGPTAGPRSSVLPTPTVSIYPHVLMTGSSSGALGTTAQPHNSISFRSLHPRLINHITPSVSFQKLHAQEEPRV